MERRMRGGKDEEKARKSPMFPRLHVNDTTERGGPRAPPRNKMALYEQLTIPSQTLSIGDGNERSVFSQFCSSPATNNLHSCSSSGISTNYRCFNSSEAAAFPTAKPSNFPHLQKISLKKLATELDSEDPNLADASSRWLSNNLKNCELFERGNSSLNPKSKSTSVDISNSIQGIHARLHQGILMETESCSRTSLTDNNVTSLGFGNGSECQEDNNRRETDRHDNVSDTSSVDLTTTRALSPDIVLQVIGEKQFWRVRRAIVNQQRVFALQVFELHRLIKVQKLLAESSQLLLEDNLCLPKPSLNISQVKTIQLECIQEQSPLLLKTKDDFKQSNNSCTECADENAVINLPHFPISKDTGKGLVSQGSNHRPYPESAPPANNGKQSSWCFPPPKTQWLISVMSPSEGLIYKPYTGPYPPPAAAFMAPFYGPMSLSPTCGSILNPNTACVSSPLGQTPFPPYGMQIMNPSISSSAIEQVSPFCRAQSKEKIFPTEDLNFIMPYQNLCNMPSQRSGMIRPCSSGNLQASKESELVGSTASSPSERAKGDALPLFPMEPIIKASENNERQTRVIKVVPHNPRLASESAERIFQSIQEERNKYD